MWCPSCGAEYRQGFTHCPDCDVDLVEEEPDEPEQPPSGPSPLTLDPDSLGPELVGVDVVFGHARGELVRSFLRGSGIEASLTGDGETWGQVYKVFRGPMAAIRVLVRPDDFEHARASLDAARRGLLEIDGDDAGRPGIMYWIGFAGLVWLVLMGFF
jgi:hypothetical protein